MTTHDLVAQGRAAYAKGMSYRNCPYPVVSNDHFSMQRTCWLLGFFNARFGDDNAPTPRPEILRMVSGR